MHGFDLTAWSRLDYVRLVFHLEFQQDFTLTLPTLLQLRRELMKVSLQLQELVSVDLASQLEQLLMARVPTDPVVRRQLAKTPPPFVLQLPETLPLSLDAGDVFELPILFWGDGRHLAPAFARLFQALGSTGLSCSEGEFLLLKVTSISGEGRVATAWAENEDQWEEPEWTLLSVGDLAKIPLDVEQKLQFRAPARLMKNGRPLFRPSLAELFPYILRRVTGMCSVWSGVEVLRDPQLLLEHLPTVSSGPRLHWEDWRELHGEKSIQPLGGVVGSLHVSCEWLELIGPVLQVGQLLNLGKGAAFGAGAWRLI